MSTNPKQLNRKPSYKIYKSPRIQKNIIVPSENSSRRIFQKETSTLSSDIYNGNILKTEPTQKMYNSNIKIYKNEVVQKPVEEKKAIKNSLSSKSYRITIKKEEVIINPMNRNKSNTKIIANNTNNQNTNIIPKFQNLNMRINSKNGHKDTTDAANSRNSKSIYIDRRQKNSEAVNKYQYRPQPQSKSSQTQIQSKYENKTLSNLENRIKLKQSQSQSHLKYNSNTSNIRIRRIPISVSSYERKTPQPNKRKDIPTGNTNNLKININTKKYNQVQERILTEPHKHNIYISNTSHYSSNVYQDKNLNNNIINKNDNYLYNKQNYNKKNESINQNKSYRSNIKTSVLEPNKINSDRNIKNNNQIYYSSSTSQNNKRQSDIKKPKAQNQNEYRHIIKDNKDSKVKINSTYKSNTQNNQNQIYHIYESKNINKENYDNKSKYNYIVKFNNITSGSRNIDTNRTQRREYIVESRKNDEIKSEKNYKITYKASTVQNAQNMGNKTPQINRVSQTNNSNINYYEKYNLKNKNASNLNSQNNKNNNNYESINNKNFNRNNNVVIVNSNY